jgi:hypothetical protein
MKKIIYRFSIIIFLIFASVITYLSIIGLETNRFNKQIQNKVNDINPKVKIELKKILLILDPINFQIKLKTLGPILKSQNDEIQIESIKADILLNAIINKNFLPKNLEISTKSLEIKKIKSFTNNFNMGNRLLIFQNFIKKGYLVANIKLYFDENGNIKKNFQASGAITDGKIKLLKDNSLEKINFFFNINEKDIKLEEVDLRYNGLDLSFIKIDVKNINNEFLVSGEINNKNFIVNKKYIERFLDKNNLKVKKINLNSNNIFSFRINKKFKFKDFKLDSQIKINELLINNDLKLKSFFPKIKNEIILRDHYLKINFDKNKLNVEGRGDILFQENKDKLAYSINKNNEDINFDISFEIFDNPFLISFLNFEKDKKNKAQIYIAGTKYQNNQIKISSAFIKEKFNKIELKKMIFDENLRIVTFEDIKFNYLDKENQKNIFNIANKENRYFLKAKSLNANNILDDLINSDDKETKFNLLENKFNFDIQIDNMRLDNVYEVRNFNGNLVLHNSNIIDANLSGIFPDSKKITFTVKSKNDEKITTLFVDKAKPIVKRYKFIKGFEQGSLDFYSSKIGNKSNSTLKIYDFKLKELPGLTKLLTLASLQGIADLLSGEGIRFNEFEMIFNNQDTLMKIEELYAIGPAISILMDGYVEKNKLISLKGTLVPATTINKVIGSIPILGQILVGSKTGEGVFGVSFKMKGPPKKLETTVNPIKTLTPRFITRTLEKIKKAN